MGTSIETFIVITTIYEPTEAIRKFAENSARKVVVVSDRKTPKNWSLPYVHFLNLESQRDLGFKLSESLPFNHYCRKMLGYLFAIKSGAKIIIDTDDDNIPHEIHTFPKFNGKYNCLEENLGFVNIYQFYTKLFIWPRGLPLRHIFEKVPPESLTRKEIKVGVWQGLADGDPDVDSIYRLTNNTECVFDKGEEIVLGYNTISPFNSQNTAFRSDLFPLLYLPTTVSFRFTDILRSYIAQAIMWKFGYHLGITNANVTQNRNAHNLMEDFKSEIPMFVDSERIIIAIQKSLSKEESIETNLYCAYVELAKLKIVARNELKLLRDWLDDLTACSEM